MAAQQNPPVVNNNEVHVRAAVPAILNLVQHKNTGFEQNTQVDLIDANGTARPQTVSYDVGNNVGGNVKLMVVSDHSSSGNCRVVDTNGHTMTYSVTLNGKTRLRSGVTSRVTLKQNRLLHMFTFALDNYNPATAVVGDYEDTLTIEWTAA
jgi:hypothetical protein